MSTDVDIFSKGDLEETLTAGDTMADGQVIKAENGGGQLATRADNTDNAVALTTDNGAYGTPYVYLDEFLAQFGAANGGGMFFQNNRFSLYSKNGIKQFGLFVDADSAASSIIGQGIYVLNNELNDQFATLSATPAAVMINAEGTIKAGVIGSAIICGIQTIAKTSYTAYVRQIGFHESGTIEGLLNNLTLTADRAWWFPDKSGTVAMLSDTAPSATESAEGKAEIGTQPEVHAGTDDARFVTPLKLASEKGIVNGLASLDGTGKVPSAQLPSYVDDVEEYANLAAFPVTGETSKIYVALDTNKIYRWTGSVYVEISADAGAPVTSVNSLIGVVVLDPDDLNDAATTNKFVTAGDITTLGNTSGTNSGDEPNANTTTAGVVVQATQPEVDAGTDDAKYVTPNDLEDKTYGTFTGSTITDNAVLKVIIQELEDAIEASQVKSTSVTKIANYTAVNGDFVIMTTGVANKTVFLPLTPANDEIVEVYKEDSAAGNLILDGNGETIQLLGSVAATQTITAQGESFTAQYIGTKWVIK